MNPGEKLWHTKAGEILEVAVPNKRSTGLVAMLSGEVCSATYDVVPACNGLACVRSAVVRNAVYTSSLAHVGTTRAQPGTELCGISRA